MLAGPRVPPGTYQVRLTVDGRTIMQRFELVQDPRVPACDADLREQYTWAKKAHDLLSRVHDAVLQLRDVRAQVGRLGGARGQPRHQGGRGALARTLTAIEEELIQVRSDDPRMFPSKLNTRIGTIVTLIEYSDAAPTKALRELTDDLARRAEVELARLDRSWRTTSPASTRSAATTAWPPSSRSRAPEVVRPGRSTRSSSRASRRRPRPPCPRGSLALFGAPLSPKLGAGTGGPGDRRTR